MTGWDRYYGPTVIGSRCCGDPVLAAKLNKKKSTARQVARGMLHCAMVKKMRCGNRCGKQNLILLRAMLLATKMLRDFMIARHVTPCNFACDLCRNKIARHVA